MCEDVTEKAYAPSIPGDGQIGCAGVAQEQRKSSIAPTLRDRLERRRNRLTADLVRVEEALRILYSVPDAERIVDVVNRSGIL